MFLFGGIQNLNREKHFLQSFYISHKKTPNKKQQRGIWKCLFLVFHCYQPLKPCDVPGGSIGRCRRLRGSRAPGASCGAGAGATTGAALRLRRGTIPGIVARGGGTSQCKGSLEPQRVTWNLEVWCFDVFFLIQRRCWTCCGRCR